MFTGIVTDIGKIVSVTPGGNKGDRRFLVQTRHELKAVPIGASIAHSGCCLTVVEKGPDWFAVEASGETLDKTHLGSWKEGTRINLELSLKLGDELGGHLVYGHVDGMGKIASMTPEGGSVRFVFETPPELARFIASKGSVAVDGISLTVSAVDDSSFAVSLIPETIERTTLGAAEPGRPVNLEVDVLAKYVEKLIR